MNIKVIADAWEPVLSENNGYVGEEAKEIDSDNLVPLLGTREASKDHHDQPRGEALVEEEVLVVLRDGLPCGQQPHHGNTDYMEVVLHRVSVLVHVVEHNYKHHYHEGQHKVQDRVGASQD